MNTTRSFFRRSRKITRNRRLRLWLETLEDRCLLATRTWTGGDPVNDLWSDADNWDTGVPVDGDDVVIPATANSAEVLFDSSVTGSGVTVNSLTSDEPFRITGDTLTLQGAGPFTMSAGLTLDGGTANFNSDTTVNTLTFSSGTLGGSGILTISGLTTWTGGTMQDGGQTSANGGMAISGANAKSINQRTLNNAGTATWTGTGSIAGGNGSTIINTALFDIQTDADFVNSFGGTATFTNPPAGTVRKSVATGVTDINFPWFVINNGTIDVQTGTLSLNNGSTYDGLGLSAANLATLNFGGGTHTLEAAVSGAGTIRFSSGTTNLTGTYNVTGATVINGGTANFNSAATTNTLDLSSGTLGGSSTLTVSGLITWTGGTMQDAGQTNANGGIAISGSNAKNINQRTLNNPSTATWTGSGSIAGGNGSTINNTGLFDIQTDADFVNSFGGTATFTNSATLRKSVATGVTDVNFPWVLNSSGTVDVQTGTLSLNNGGTGTGSFSAADLATLNFGGGTYNLDASSTVTGAGTIGFSSGITNVAGTYDVAGRTLINGGTANFTSDATTATLELSSGTLGGNSTVTVSGLTTWTGGTMSGTGQTNANGGIAISGNNTKSINQRTLNNAGTATWTGNGSIAGGNGSTINNTALFDIQTDADFVNSFGGTATFTNSAIGTLRKSVATGITDVNFPWVVNNLGTIDVQTGTLSLNNGGTGSGSFSAADLATLNFGGGTYNLDATSTVSGAGTIGFSSGTVNLAGTYNVAGRTLINGGTANVINAATTGTLELTSGTLTGSSTLTVSGLTTWTGGTMNGTGQTNADGGMAISGTNNKSINQRTLNNAGNAAWTGSGNIAGGNGSTINNTGLFDIQTDADFLNSFGGTALFNNSGTGILRKSAATGSTDLNFPWAFTNTGSVEAQSGNLGFLSYVQTAGSLLLIGGSVSSIQTMQIEGGIIAGSGTITANINNTGGTLTPGISATGLIEVVGDYVQTDGTAPSGELSIELGGLTPVSEFDQVNVSGLNHEATLAGTLTATLINGFTPSLGDSFIILQGPASGAFDTLNLPSLPAGQFWQVTVGPASVTLTVLSENGEPIVTLSGGNALSVDEGTTETYDFAINDPDGDTITDVTVSCGTNGVQVGVAIFGNTSGSFQCNFPDGPASSTISVSATDSGGNTGNTATQGVTVNNVAPSVVLSGQNDLTVDEGTTHTYDFTISDPGVDTVTDVTVSCGANGTQVGTATFTDTSGSFQCNFPNGPGTSTVSASATDSDDDTGTADSQTVTINGAGPTVTFPAGNDLTVDEGTTHTYNFTISDLGGGTITAVTVSCGANGTQVGTATFTDTTGSFECNFPDGPATSTVSASATNSDADTGAAATQTVTINNVAPTVTLSPANDLSVDEGTTHTYNFTINDPGVDTITGVTVSCGANGTQVGTATFTNTTGSFQCNFPDGPATSTVSASATDSDDETGLADTQTVTIDDVAPTVTLSPDNDLTVDEGTTHTYEFTISDPGLDTIIEVTVSCGANGTEVGTATFTDTSGSFQCNFPTGPASSTISASATDSDENTGEADTQTVIVNGPDGGGGDEGRCTSDNLGGGEGSGNVTAKVSQGKLLIRGDGKANNILIEAGRREGSLRISGRDNTTVNGGTGEVELRDFEDVTIAMGAGSDVVAIVDALLQEGLRVKMQSQDDDLILCGVEVQGTARTGAGRGKDTLSVDDSIFHDDTHLGIGRGADEIQIERKGKKNGPRTDFKKKLKIRTEEGNDKIKIGKDGDEGNSVKVDGCTEVLGGEGHDTFDAKHDGNKNKFDCGPNLKSIEEHD